MPTDVSQRARSVIDNVTKWGITPEIQTRLGVFSVIWGMLETNLENTVHALRNEKMGPGMRPSTDATSIADWIRILGQPSPRIPARQHALMEYASLAAIDLMEYRHAVVHGWLVPGKASGVSSFIRNPRWKGEIR